MSEGAVALPRVLVPLGVFGALVALLAVGLTLDPREVPSPLVGKPAPQFTLPLLHAPEKTFSPSEMTGRAWMLNVWASWCPPCLAEHPIVTDLARSGLAPVVGLNYKDRREDALAWLARNGDPFLLSVADADGRIAIDYGVYGVPETYVIDRDGVIRYKHIGPLTREIAERKIVPLLRELGGGRSPGG
jgi:cytochrome c biogenesis protein CcmG/thiol:disulfide interchange protein DsbE